MDNVTQLINRYPTDNQQLIIRRNSVEYRRPSWLKSGGMIFHKIEQDNCFILHYSGKKQSRISVDYERRMFSVLCPYLGSVIVLNNKYM